MTRIAGLCAIVALCAFAGPAAADWNRGDAGDTREATVTGDLFGSLTVYCPFGQPGNPAGLLASGATFPSSDQVQSDQVRIDFNVDGAPHTLTGTFDGELRYEARTREAFDRLAALVAALRAGNRLQIDVTALNWSESFSLKGSSEALAGILEGCAPK